MAPDDPTELPPAARRLLLGPVDSFEKLEMVLALRDASGSAVAVDALAARAGLPVARIDAPLAELAAAGLAERLADGAWRLAPTADAAGLQDLADTWATRRPAVLKAMTARAVERIRASAARAFAEAFRLRRRKDDGDNDG